MTADLGAHFRRLAAAWRRRALSAEAALSNEENDMNDTLTQVDRYTALVAAKSAKELLDIHERAVRQLAKADFGSELWETSGRMVEITRAELLRRLS